MPDWLALDPETGVLTGTQTDSMTVWLEWTVDSLSGVEGFVLLRVFGDLSMAEIADVVGKSRTAVKVAHFRAMKALRVRLAGGM